MGDVQRCFKCQGDRLATTMKDGMPLCNECAGLPPEPSVADRFAALQADQKRAVEEMFRNRFRRPSSVEEEKHA